MLVSWLDLRRAVGTLLVAAGASHSILMAAAVLYAQGAWRPRLISAAQWHHLYDAHALFFFFSGVVYLLIMAWRTDALVRQPALDLVVGLLLLRLIFRALRIVLRQGFFTPWIALFPGLCLVGYGLALRNGRQWSRLELG